MSHRSNAVSCHLYGDVHSQVFMTVDRAVELIGAFLQGNGEVAGASGCEQGAGLVLYARAVDDEVVVEFALIGSRTTCSGSVHPETGLHQCSRPSSADEIRWSG